MGETIKTNESIYDLNDYMLNVVELTASQRKFRASGKAFSGDVYCDVCGKTIKDEAKASRIVARDEDESHLTFGPTCARKWLKKVLGEVKAAQ